MSTIVVARADGVVTLARNRPRKLDAPTETGGED